MQMTRRSAARLSSLAALSGFVLAGFAVSGCNHTDAGGGSILSPTSSSGTAVATLTTPKNAVLTVTEPQFYAQLQNYVPNTPPQTFAPVGQAAGRLVLQQLMQNLIVEGLAQDTGVAPTDAEVNTQFNNIKLIQNARNIKPFEQALSEAGLSQQLFEDLQIKPQLSQLKLLTKGVTITDAEIQSYYNVNKDKQFTKPARAHIKRIVVATLPEAAAITKEIAGGKTFESEVTKTLDKATLDGDVNQWVPLDNPDPRMASLTQPIKAAAVGTVAAPITVPGANGQNSYWVVKVIEKKDKETPALADVKELIRANLLQQKASENPTAQQDLQKDLRNFQPQVKIVTQSPQYQALATELMHPQPAAAAAGGPTAPRIPGGPR